MSDTASNTEKPSMKQAVLRWVLDIALAVVITWLITLAFRPTIVVETSMLPNFKAHDYLFISRLSYRNEKLPRKGDVIVFRSDLLDEKGRKKLLIKRVIGLPNDVIDIRDGEVYINGKKDSQSYTKDGVTPGLVVSYRVPKGCVYCLGDNRVASVDSRSPEVGAIKTSRIVGKVVFRVYRFNKFGPIHNPYQS